MQKRAIIQLLLLVCLAFCLIYCKATPASNKQESSQPVSGKPVSSQETAKTIHDGIYVGIVTFGPHAQDITEGKPIYLDRNGEGLSRLKDLLDTKYQSETSGGTALFYAAHMSIANMTKAKNELPILDDVILLTFTDGFDVSSTGLTLAPIDDPGDINSLQFGGEPISLYEEFIKREIDNRSINGSQIDAYVAAVKGDDITNVSAFEASLKSLASSGTNSKGVSYIRPPAPDISGLINMFEQIAYSLVDAWTEQNFTIVTPQYPIGTKIRMTFSGEQNSQQAQNARFFVEGEVGIRDRQYYLTNIKYGGGINSRSGNEIKGTIEENMVKYMFPVFTGFDLTDDRVNNDIKQWINTTGESGTSSEASRGWQINSEYEPRPATKSFDVRSNALVYLVLDQSSSISPGDIPKVRQAAKLFLDMISNAYYSHN